MIAPDLIAEHTLALPLKQSDLDSFMAEGVKPLALARSIFGDYGIIARDIVVFGAGGRFEFARHLVDNIHEVQAQNAYTLPLLNQCGDVADILAFRPGGPAALWLGRIGMAGEEQVLRPRLGDLLDVHESPLDWLRADRCGIVVLNYLAAARTLEGHTLQAASPDHARRLRIALARPAPPVVVRQSVYNVHDKGGRAA